MTFFYLKALHLVGMVSWFAGLFYLVRIFVYHVEAQTKGEPDRGILTTQYALMEHRVYRIICTPAMVLTWIGGIGMLVWHGWDWIVAMPWFHFKFALLLGLVGYHFYCRKLIHRLDRGVSIGSSTQMRLLNEVPALLLITIVLLATLKNSLNALLALGLVFLLGLIIFAVVKRGRRAKVTQTPK